METFNNTVAETKVVDTKRAAHDERFAGYRKPTEVTIPKFKAIQEKTKELADMIFEECPDSLEKSKALTDLQNVRMWANAAIAIHTPGAEVEKN